MCSTGILQASDTQHRKHSAGGPLRCHPPWLRAQLSIRIGCGQPVALHAPRQPSANRSCRKSPLAEILDLCMDWWWYIMIYLLIINVCQVYQTQRFSPMLTCFDVHCVNFGQRSSWGVCVAWLSEGLWATIEPETCGNKMKKKNDRTADVAASPERTWSIESFHQSGDPQTMQRWIRILLVPMEMSDILQIVAGSRWAAVGPVGQHMPTPCLRQINVIDKLKGGTLMQQWRSH